MDVTIKKNQGLNKGFTPSLKFRQPQSVPSSIGEHAILESNVFSPASRGRQQNQSKFSAGFTLIEILVVIGIIAILAAVVLIAINPARQFAQARNSQRTSNINAILNAVGQRMADNKGIFAGAGCIEIDTTSTSSIKSASGGSGDIAPCLVPTYITAMPFDPKVTGARYNSNTDYDSKYEVKRDSVTSRITVCVPTGNEEIDQSICITR